ncbi:MAG: phage major capsid protein [Rhodobacteraceae bacterium]|nr:phage major capsid protein [Paracoccaceae bacterium]
MIPRTTPSPNERTLDAALDVKSAMADFMRELTQFKSTIASQLQHQEKQITMLEQKSRILSRPALAANDTQSAPHRKAFSHYLRSGDDSALRGLELEGKAMSTSSGSDGGFLVDPQTSATIDGVLSAHGSLRSIASVVQTEAGSYEILVDGDNLASVWVGETATRSETASPKINRITINLHELSALPKVSQRLLDDSAFDIEGWLASRIAERFGRAEATSFITGDGNNKPKGITAYTNVANGSWAWGKMGYVNSGANGSIQASSALLDLIYALGAEYRANAHFVMNSRTVSAVRRLKDADNRFLWTDGMTMAEPARLMGYPVVVSEDMPNMTRGSLSIAFGDFARGYTIAERPEMRVLRDPFSAKPHVLFYATKRVGGGVSDFAAIKFLRLSVS